MTNQATHPVTLISHIFVLPGKVGAQNMENKSLTRLVWCTQQLELYSCLTTILQFFTANDDFQ